MSSPLSVETVAGRLSKVRRSEGKTQEEFAAILSIPLGTWRGYEQGKREVSAGVIVAMLDLFGVSPVWLLTGRGSSELSLRARPIDDDQAEGIANKVYRIHQDKFETVEGKIEALKSAAIRGADRAVANAPTDKIRLD